MARRKSRRTITLRELTDMHAEANRACRDHDGLGLGAEAYSLVCALGACMGNWPRVRASKAKELRQRMAALKEAAK